MKRWIAYGVGILLLSWLSPARGTDVAELQPVELMMVSVENENVVLETDTNDVGKGENLERALENLKESAPGSIFLDTVEFLVVQDSAAEYLPQLIDLLRPGTTGCFTAERIDPEKAAEYLSAHKPSVTLRAVRYESGMLPLLNELEGRFELVERFSG